ncbi:hypothetical protein [Paenisporosarcina sp.]|uniref:hypothetical protein n=1 Tax=Paenisporosarcina sp. TaxID=1932001 RepID=UPI003C70E220
MTYDDFKTKVNTRTFYALYNDGYPRVINFVNDVYGEENIKAFYGKNLVNELDVELFFVFEKGILKVSKQKNADSDFVYDFMKSKVNKKSLITSRYLSNPHVLTVLFENGEHIVFHNKEDSNYDWASEYSEFILELYKAL